MAYELDIDERKTLIKRQPFFSQFNEAEIETLVELFHDKRVKAGDVIVKEGDLVDSIYLIVDGVADVRKIMIMDHKTSTVKSVASLGPNEAVGLNETGFYSISGIRTASVIATTDMYLLRLSVPAFHGFALSNSHVNSIMRKNSEKFLAVKS